MAVKVMMARSIARGELPKSTAAKRSPSTGDPTRSRRRRATVYDADGNEVFITLICLKCNKIRPLSSFGLRKMADGAIRNQPWCKACRSAPAEEPRRRGAARRVDSPAGESPSAVPAATPGEAERRPAGSVAAEVAAALAAGRGR